MSSWSSIARKIRVPLGFVFAALYIWLARPTPASLLSGAVLVLLGLGIRALASGHVQKNEQLTTSGPYAYTRNPLYLGSLILACGFALAARSWWVGLGIVILFLAIYLPVIRSEEVFLRSKFSEFGEYAAQVPSLLPRLTPFRGHAGTFSWKLYAKHREYNALVGSAVVAAALVIKLFWIR